MTKIATLEYWSDVHMATTVLQRNLKSLIDGNGIGRWHPNGFLLGSLSMAQGMLVDVCIRQREFSME